MFMETFKKEERLYNKKVIEYLFSKGESFFLYPFKIIWCIDERDSRYPARVLISVSRHNFKKANNRNKIKRQIREIYRKNKFKFYDFLNDVDRKCAFALIYTAKDVLSHKELEQKIILILQRLQIEYEKAAE